MPFTFSHPAIIVPFKYLWKKRFSSTALVAGSVAPDFEYFVRFHNWSAHSHTWSGIFWFDIPVGIFLCFLFHDVIKRPLFENLPMQVHKRVIRFASFNWKRYFTGNWMIVLYSLLIGIVSHIVWDKFTHQSYRFFDAVPNLDDSLDPDFHPSRVYRIIQISYSAFGMAVLALTIKKLPPDNSIKYPLETKAYWTIFSFITISVIGMTILFVGFEFVDWIITVLSSMLIGLTAGSFFLLKDKWAFLKGWR